MHWLHRPMMLQPFFKMIWDGWGKFIDLSRTKMGTINTGLRVRELVDVWWDKDIDGEKTAIRVSEKPDWKLKDDEERTVRPWGAMCSADRTERNMAEGSMLRCAGHLFGRVWTRADFTLCAIRLLPAIYRRAAISKTVGTC
jgi:hypothetical protein